VRRSGTSEHTHRSATWRLDRYRLAQRPAQPLERRRRSLRRRLQQPVPRPAYQDGVPHIGRTRGVPDVAANADASTAMALTFSGGGLYPSPGHQRRHPLWAGVIALADQDAGQHLGLVNPAIYAIARSPARLPPRLPRRGHRRQLGAMAHRRLHRLPSRTRVGPSHRLGQPQRPHPRPPPRARRASWRHKILTHRAGRRSARRRVLIPARSKPRTCPANMRRKPRIIVRPDTDGELAANTSAQSNGPARSPLAASHLL